MLTKFFSGAVCVLLLGGCSTNQLLREETHAFATASVAATDAGKGFYDGLVTSDRQLRTLLYTLDADCVPPSLANQAAFVQLVPEPDGTYDYCRPAPGNPGSIQLKGGFTPNSFNNEYLALNFVASYVKALAKLAAEPELNAAKNFQEAITDLELLNTAANPASDPLLNTARKAAVSGLIGFLQTLADESKTAKEIRAAIEKNGAKAGEHLTALVSALELDQDFADALDSVRTNIVSTAIRDNRTIDAATRSALLAEYYAQEDRLFAATGRKKETEQCSKLAAESADPVIQAGGKYCGKPAAGLMASTKIAHDELTELAKGNLNERQRARQAQLAFRRFMTALKMFVDLRGAF